MASFLVATVLFALLGVFITAAQSIADQRLRAAATRVGNAHLETLRAVPFSQLDAQAGTTTETTPDGRSFTVDTTVTPVSAATGDPDPNGQVRRVNATVSWTSGGETASLDFSTVIAPPAEETAVAGQSIGTPVMFPNPTTVDSAGTPTQPIEVSVPLEGFATAATVTMAWDDDGGAKQATLTSADGQSWTTTIDPTRMTRAVPEGQTADLDLTFTVDSLSTSTSLTLQRAAASPPTITGATISQNPVTVAAPAPGRTCDARNQCHNTQDVVFTATVGGLDPAQDAVVLQYQLYDGSFEEIPLTHVTGTEWRATVRARTTKFAPGTAQPFRFNAVRTMDGATATATVERDVVRT